MDLQVLSALPPLDSQSNVILPLQQTSQLTVALPPLGNFGSVSLPPLGNLGIGAINALPSLPVMIPALPAGLNGVNGTNGHHEPSTRLGEVLLGLVPHIKVQLAKPVAALNATLPNGQPLTEDLLHTLWGLPAERPAVHPVFPGAIPTAAAPGAVAVAGSAGTATSKGPKPPKAAGDRTSQPRCEFQDPAKCLHKFKSTNETGFFFCARDRETGNPYWCKGHLNRNSGVPAGASTSTGVYAGSSALPPASGTVGAVGPNGLPSMPSTVGVLPGAVAAMKLEARRWHVDSNGTLLMRIKFTKIIFVKTPNGSFVVVGRGSRIKGQAVYNLTARDRAYVMTNFSAMVISTNMPAAEDPTANANTPAEITEAEADDSVDAVPAAGDQLPPL